MISARRRASGVCIALLAAIATGACSADSADTTAWSVDDRGSAGAGASVATSEPAPNTESPTVPAASPPVDTGAAASIATVPVVGVPGIDSDDPFCRGWSEFAGSFQALTFASVTAVEPLGALRSEVIASGALLAAVEAIATSLPDEIADERVVFVDGLLGPFARRAERARDELLAAGADDADVALLGSSWLDALASAGLDDEVIDVSIPDDLAPAVDAATAAFGAGVPPIPDDPSLITDADAPRTRAYLAENCPDQGTLAGNDVID